MRIKTSQLKFDLRIEDAAVDQGALVLKGVASFLPCDVCITPPEARHLLRLMFRRETLGWTLRALFTRPRDPS